MKLLKLFIISALFIVSTPLFAISEKDISRALKDLPAKLAQLPPEIKTLAVYQVKKDPRGRYNSGTITACLAGKIEKISRFTLVSRSALGAAFEEQSLSATGLVDPETVKEIGKTASVDAFLFVYPNVTRTAWNPEQLVISIQAVEVDTSAIIWVAEFKIDTPRWIRLAIGFDYRYVPNQISLTHNFDNSDPFKQDWSHSFNSVSRLDMMPVPTVDLMIPSFRLLDLQLIPFSMAVFRGEKLSAYPEQMFVEDREVSMISYKDIDFRAFICSALLRLHLGEFWQARRDIINLRLGGGLVLLTGISQISYRFSEGSTDVNRNLDTGFSTAAAPLIKGGLDFYLGANFRLKVDYNYVLPVSYKKEDISGTGVGFEMKMDKMWYLTFGLQYYLF
ncbi:MAG TPA: hypothetical protein VKS21_05715 [Spirochaetota bacterium]|nr:hypothetical protein [Spirochaetota bacterium]